MSRSYYIYYRVDPSRAAVALARVNQLLNAIQDGSGITGRLLKKRGEPNLWMEVYENVSDEARFERDLAAAVDKLGAADFLQPGSGRRVECFEG